MDFILSKAFTSSALSSGLRTEGAARSGGNNVNIWLRFILGSWIATLVLHEIDIGGKWMPVDPSTWIILVGWTALYATFFAVASQIASSTPSKPRIYAVRASTIFLILISTSALGASLVIFDFSVLRGYGFNTSAALIRALETDAAMRGVTSSSAISGTGRLMLPAALPALVIFVSNPGFLNSSQKFIASIFVLIILYEQLFFEGGRFFLSVSAVVGLICYFTRMQQARGTMKLNITSKMIVWVVFGGTILMTFFGYVFATRIAERDDFYWSAYRSFTSYFALTVDQGVIDSFEGLFGIVRYSSSMLWLYATQGINEIDAVFALNQFGHAWGLYQFPQFGQIAQMLLGVEWRYDMVMNLPTVGTYLTMPGASYVDFGLTGMFLQGIIFGTLSGWSMFRFANGHQSGFALCGPILIAVALFSPVVSLFTNVWPAFVWCGIYNLILAAISQKPSS
jgi:hypothetical protein